MPLTKEWDTVSQAKREIERALQSNDRAAALSIAEALSKRTDEKLVAQAGQTFKKYLDWCDYH
jgi:hypothetical protein